MDNASYQQKLDELERLLNDETIALDPDRILSLLSEVLRYQAIANRRDDQ